MDIAAYERHIEICLEELQQSGDLCRGCPELRELDNAGESLRLNARFQTVSFNMHRHLCNCRCVYCELWKKSSAAYEVLPAVKSLWRRGALRRDCFFSWGGGEPGILPEFEKACAWIRDKGFKQYVHTNALRRSGAIASLLAAGAGGVNISLDSASPAVYKAVKGVDGFGRVTANIRDYAALAADRGDVSVKYIIFSLNNSAEEIENFFALCRSMGVVDVQFSFDFREVNADSLSRSTLRAAVLFVRLAQSMNMRCAPFFVDKGILDSMVALAGEEEFRRPAL